MTRHFDVNMMIIFASRSVTWVIAQCKRWVNLACKLTLVAHLAIAQSFRVLLTPLADIPVDYSDRRFSDDCKDNGMDPLHL